MSEVGLILPAGFVVRSPDGYHYCVKGLLGQGGFGAVYLVHDKRAPQRLFALKEITDPDQKERARFLFEGEVLKRLRHPALPRVYKVFDHPQLRRVYILMDFIQGQNLENIRMLQTERCFPFPIALSLLRTTAEALSYIHSQQPPIIHRDIKPSNIIVPLGMERSVLVDFGIAKEYIHNMTTTAMRHGSPGYAAPEHYTRGTNVRTDVYGLGATMYTLLSGVVPPDAITRATAYHRHDPLKPLHMLDVTIPLYISYAIERALAISNEDRFATIEEFWYDLTHPRSGQQYPLPDSQDLKIALTRTTTGEDLEKKATSRLEAMHTCTQQRKRQRYKKIFLFLLTLICITVPADAILIQTFMLQKRHTTAAATPLPMYPRLAPNYAGTVSDPYNMDLGKPFYLLALHQQGQYVQGQFEGLGIASMFTGHLTPQGHLTFTVKYPDGTGFISFEGDVNIGGGLAGNYTILNSSQQSTGLHGVWQGQQ